MAVSLVVMLMILYTSVLQVAMDGSYFSQFYPLHKALESGLTTEETLYTMRQAFFPVVHTSAQEIQQVLIFVCVEIMVDQTLNSPSCIASHSLNADKSANVSSLCWEFLWTDSALLSLITVDQIAAFDSLSSVIYDTAIGNAHYDVSINAVLPLICSVTPKTPDIKTSLMLLLSWSKSYARHRGVPPQWEEIDKGYIQQLYNDNFLAESTYDINGVHLIRLGMTITFTLLNVLVLIGVLSYGKQCYIKVYQYSSGSPRLIAVTWAFMITASLMNSFYLLDTIHCLVSLGDIHPKVWACLISEADWCASMKSAKLLYSDEVASLLVKLTVFPFTTIVELIIAVRLTSHTLLPFPCIIATISKCYSFRIGKRVIHTILIWNVMIFIQITFGVVFLPAGILMVIAPVTTFSCISTIFLIVPVTLIWLITCIIIKWCIPISFKQCCSLSHCAYIFAAVVILSLSAIVILLYYSVIGLGVEPWSMKRSILSLLPSFLVTPVLWFAKRYFFKKDRAVKVAE